MPLSSFPYLDSSLPGESQKPQGQVRRAEKEMELCLLCSLIGVRGSSSSLSCPLTTPLRDGAKHPSHCVVSWLEPETHLSLSPYSPGVETITVYEEILRQARYQLRHGAALYARKFRLSCSEMNGRYSSNEFIVEVPGESLPFLGHLLRARSQDVWTSDRWLMDKDLVALKSPRPTTDGRGGDVG